MKKNTDPNPGTWDYQWKKYNLKPYFKPNLKLIGIILKIFNKDLKNKKILELGAGSGSDITLLTQLGADGYGSDFSSKSIDSIKYWSKQKRVRVHAVQADIYNLPFKKNYFDLVYSVGLMEHFQEALPLIKKQLDIVKPGGYLIIDVPQKFTLYSLAKHIRMGLNTHPFGWETEYSKGELVEVAKMIGQKPHLIYGREYDVFDKLSLYLKTKFLHQHLLPLIERSWLAPYMCLCVGLVIKKK